MRIAIVNDSAIALEAMRRIVEASDDHQMAWSARDGAEAITKCQNDTPDLILMDLIMPKVDGVEATRRIMAATPCAILVVTASVNGRAGKVFEALGAGALDAISTPTLASHDGAESLLGKFRTLNRLIGAKPNHADKTRLKQPSAPQDRLIAIGASAGGPAALAEILSGLPKDYAAPIVIVQHIDAQFASGMADWLGAQSSLPVRLACEGDRPQAGEVLIAGGDEHLVFTGPGILGYKPEPSDLSCRPSIDVFFQSLIGQWRGQITAILLTGMGRDGARGMAALRKSGALTIVQDRETSVVYGMPKAAIELGAAGKVLPLGEIAPALVALARNGTIAK